MKRSAAIILTVAATAVLSQASNIEVSTYNYDTAEDWVKAALGGIAGITTAVVAEQSTNACFKSAISASDTILEYSYTAAIKQRVTDLDWILWGGIDIGLILFFGGKAIFDCASVDPNFGWATPSYLPEQDVSKMIVSPWTQDFIISLAGVFTGAKTAITRNSDVDPFWIAKKLGKNLTSSFIKLINALIYYSFGF